jgi:hypothetical protein
VAAKHGFTCCTLSSGSRKGSGQRCAASTQHAQFSQDILLRFDRQFIFKVAAHYHLLALPSGSWLVIIVERRP